MPTHVSPISPLTPRHDNLLRPARRALASATLLATLMSLALSASAHAGTYVINNCPAAPGANSNAGEWTVFGSPQADRAACTGGTGAFIGPLGGNLGPNTSAGVKITAPSPITIRQARVWWYVPAQISGATTFADVSTNAGFVGGSTTPLDDTTTPETFELPSTTTSFTLADYCSSDDGPTGCTFGAGENPILKLLGAQLTLEDTSLPSGNPTGGALATTTGTLTGTQTLVYSAKDPSSGVRLVKLLIDDNQATENDYLGRCPYEDFLACPASISDTLRWNTATVPDGTHTLEAIVENAAQNTSIFYTATITTNNAPTNTTLPAIATSSQSTVGTTLTATPGGWSAPAGAGTITYTYQWQDCNNEGNNCQTIPTAQTATYTPTTQDTGHALRVTVSATDNDGTTSVASPATSTITSSPVQSGGLGNTALLASVPNGTPASETATLHLNGPATITRSFAQRAFKITGKLTTNHTQPIADATLDVLEQTQGASAPTIITHTTTKPTGAFTLSVPAGPSRIIEIAYRALSSDANYTATARIRETVHASAQLTITPRNTSPTGTVIISGRVRGPIPRQGTIVELLVHYHGRWEPFRDPRTNSHGYFHIAYQFQGAVGRFPFQAQILAGQAGYPYSNGHSNTVDISAG